MREASKTLSLLTPEEVALLSGKGLDIGCGNDPVRADVQRFDVEDGDANCVTCTLKDRESFDYVFSSHCLEHMRDPYAAIADWWKLVKSGGALFVIVPDEDLYEQGYWPSLFNDDHKFTFTIAKEHTWSPVSCNMRDLVATLTGAQVVSLRVQDHGYRHPKRAPGGWSRGVARYAAKLRIRFAYLIPPTRRPFEALSMRLGLPVDQTRGNASAQILLVLTKAR